MKIDLNQFRDAFFEEATEHVAHMESGLLRLEEAPDDREVLNEVFRAAHSIKGASGTFGLTDVTRFTHALEGILDDMREGKVAVGDDLIEPLLKATDMLRDLMASARANEAAPAELDGMLALLNAAHHRKSSGAEHAPEPKPAEAAAPAEATGARPLFMSVRPKANLFQTGMDPLLLLRDVRDLSDDYKVTPALDALPDLEAMDPGICYMRWDLAVTTRKSDSDYRDVFVFVSDECEIMLGSSPIDAPAEAPATAAPGADEAAPAAKIASKSKSPERKHSAGGEASSIRVATEKVDEIINLVSELVIAQSAVTQVLSTVSPESAPRLLETVAAMQRHTRDLQERVMSVRMVPIASVFSRFPRLVRDLASKFGKQIVLEVNGEDTELDKTVVEGLGDPLTHLVRNSIDHGIESPADRAAAGKPEQGTIKLSAYHQGGSVIIEVTDDGAGLKTERIREKAVAQELIKAEDDLTDEQIHSLIFLPGFSTANAVSDISGRGVGMDVVKRNVEALNGFVSISSRRGEGSTFRLKLPLTLAILDGLSLAVGKQIYIIPLLAIVESFRPAEKDLQRVMGRGEVVMVRGEALPLIRLHSVFGIPDAKTEPTQALIVIVETEGRRIGIMVDELLGQAQVVIKNLEANFRRIDGVMGATILGDGSVALILDIVGVTRIYSHRSASAAADAKARNVPSGARKSSESASTDSSSEEKDHGE